MKTEDKIIECPCYRICAGLGLELKRWCRYRKSDLPPPGLHRFDPKDEWCPTGVQANVLLLGYMLSGKSDDPGQLTPMLEQVRNWARELRKQPAGYDPVKPKES